MAKQKLNEVLSVNDGASARGVGDTVNKAACYTANLAELLGQFGDEFVDVEGNVIKFDFNTVVKLLNVLWAKVKETAQECESKEIQVKLPDGLVGQLIAGVLAIVGIKL